MSRIQIWFWFAELASFTIHGCSAAAAASPAQACAGGCSGHGSCGVAGICLCEEAWAGRDCGFALDDDPTIPKGSTAQLTQPTWKNQVLLETDTCMDSCSGQGRCVAGSCVCKQGFFGPSCADRGCANDCNGHGTCSAGSCHCEPGFAGKQCEMMDVVTLSQTHSRQLAGSPETSQVAAATPGLRGHTAQQASDVTASPISAFKKAHRAAKAVRQVADQLYEAAQLEHLEKQKAELAQERSRVELQLLQKEQERENKERNKRDVVLRMQRAISEAHGHMGKLPGHEFAHEETSSEVALLDKRAAVAPAKQLANSTADSGACSLLGCSGHGTCNAATGHCQCHEGWKGSMCDTKPCANNCEGRGMCLSGTCVCSPNFFGGACQHSRCPGDCSGRGYCFSGRCQCSGPYGGESCLLQVHSEKGIRMKMPPQLPRLKGLPTAEMSTLRSSSKAHRLRHADFFSNQDKSCPRLCSNRGHCIEGSCLCYEGFYSSDCSKTACCSGRGECPTTSHGVCKCDPGWGGDNCDVELVCLDQTCSGHGICVNGKCVCALGYSGATCQASFVSCMGRCSRGTCAGEHATYCDCQPGYTGMLCEVEMTNKCGSGNDCSGHGSCMNGFCACYAPWVGDSCQHKTDMYGDVYKIEQAKYSPYIPKLNKTFMQLNGTGKEQLLQNESHDLPGAAATPQGLVQASLEQKQENRKDADKKTRLKTNKTQKLFAWEEAQAKVNSTAKSPEVVAPKETSVDASVVEDVMDLGSPVTSSLMTGGFAKPVQRSLADALRASRASVPDKRSTASMAQSSTASTDHGKAAAAAPQEEAPPSDQRSSAVQVGRAAAEISADGEAPAMLMPLHPERPRKNVSAFIGALRVKR